MSHGGIAFLDEPDTLHPLSGTGTDEASGGDEDETVTARPAGILGLLPKLDLGSDEPESQAAMERVLAETDRAFQLGQLTIADAAQSWKILPDGSLKIGSYIIRAGGSALTAPPGGIVTKVKDEKDGKESDPVSAMASELEQLSGKQEWKISSDNLVQLDVLGKGASGRVLKCLHVPSKKILAIKCIDIGDKAKRDQMVREFAQLQRTNSPYIVSFYGAFFEEGVTKLALEFMNRGSLQSIVKEHGPLSEPVLASVAQQSLYGLLYLHEQRQIHRDIKPGNILVNHTGEVKISDFGIIAEVNNTLAQAQTFVGTTIYMSPERIHSQKYSFTADIWSLGLSLFTCAIGKFPISMENGYFGLLNYLAKHEPPQLPSTFSKEFRDFMSKCLIKDYRRRWTAKQLLDHPFCKKAPTPEDVCAYWPKKLQMSSPVVISPDQLEEPSDGCRTAKDLPSPKTVVAPPSYPPPAEEKSPPPPPPPPATSSTSAAASSVSASTKNWENMRLRDVQRLENRPGHARAMSTAAVDIRSRALAHSSGPASLAASPPRPAAKSQSVGPSTAGSSSSSSSSTSSSSASRGSTILPSTVATGPRPSGTLTKPLPLNKPAAVPSTSASSASSTSGSTGASAALSSILATSTSPTPTPTGEKKRISNSKSLYDLSTIRRIEENKVEVPATRPPPAKDARCQFCEKEEATQYCGRCSCQFCESCSKMHKNGALFRGHEVVPLPKKPITVTRSEIIISPSAPSVTSKPSKNEESDSSDDEDNRPRKATSLKAIVTASPVKAPPAPTRTAPRPPSTAAAPRLSGGRPAPLNTAGTTSPPPTQQRTLSPSGARSPVTPSPSPEEMVQLRTVLRAHVTERATKAKRLGTAGTGGAPILSDSEIRVISFEVARSLGIYRPIVLKELTAILQEHSKATTKR